MEELSIEEKAKAYDEAIERAKNFIKNGDERERTIAESIFAGLMEESEDERIRKQLIVLAKGSLAHTDEEINEMIAWLEKQGEQKPAEWSEEDKRKIDRIYSILLEAADTHAFSTSCRLIGDKECVELQDFLKSLRPQNKYAYNPYKVVVESIAEMCKHYDKATDLQDFYDNVKGKCKDAKEYDSLFPQNTWKPCEQDIILLERIFDGKLDPRNFQASLQGIIGQLKKLREE